MASSTVGFLDSCFSVPTPQPRSDFCGQLSSNGSPKFGFAFSRCDVSLRRSFPWRKSLLTDSRKQIQLLSSLRDPCLNLLKYSRKEYYSIKTFSAKAALNDVPHLSDWLPHLPSYPNPLHNNPAYSSVDQYFVGSEDFVLENTLIKADQDPSQINQFRRAGPRESIVFRSDEVRAAIVTCGGLCPGLNTVIRELVYGLWGQYGVRDILGIDGGYRGFYARNLLSLNPKVVNDIHKRGGTVLGTSRGGHETTKIVNSIEDRGINHVYIIGGDGTQRGADIIHKEVMRRGLKVAIAGIPKTIDNDIAVIDKSFGFDTAVEEAQRAINAAHVEAESVENGVGLVKLMGRYSGYIAMYATLASRDVDCCLIPEIPFYLEGPGGLFEFVRKRLRENGHIVLVVAEGAGQELIAESMDESFSDVRDASGNRLLLDIGLWLSQRLKEYFLREYHQVLNLKYIDPTYMIRAIPSNASDNVYCTLLAHSAIHGAMAGFTGFTVGPVNSRHAYIPIARVTEKTNKVNVGDRMWARLLSSTQQPSFMRSQPAIEYLSTQDSYLACTPKVEKLYFGGNSSIEPPVPSHRLDGPATSDTEVEQEITER